jgi:hypothetical protein
MVACSKVFWSWWVDYYAHARSFVEFFFPYSYLIIVTNYKRWIVVETNGSIKWLRCDICLVCLGGRSGLDDKHLCVDDYQNFRSNNIKYVDQVL